MGLGSGIRDPGSGKTYFRSRIPDPGVKKAPDPDPGSATLLEGLKITQKSEEILVFEVLDDSFCGTKTSPVALTSFM
jgi:hypothetical protein